MPDTATVPDALQRLSTAVEDLIGLDLTTLHRDALLDLLRGLECQRRRLPVLDHRLISELDARGVAGDLAARDTKTLLRDVLRLSPRDATGRYTAAVDLGPRRAVTGAALPPLFPRVAAAQAAGVISAEHARVVTRTVAALPAEVEWEHGRDVEARLVTEAARFDPQQLATLAKRITECLDPDGVLADQADHDRRRAASLSGNTDGSGDLHAHLTPACFAQWQAVLDPLAKPHPSDADGPDPRTPGQRLHDALEDCAVRLLASGSLPDCGGTPATVLLTMTPDQAATGAGYATTGHGQLIPVGAALRIADQASLIPVTLDHDGAVFACGRDKRIATPTQRAALAARDRGCSFPGCDHPVAWCQAHHVIPWANGGPTTLNNLTLLCGWHHREFQKRGWQVTMKAGIPWWVPPPHIDPDQTPIRNTMHDI